MSLVRMCWSSISRTSASDTSGPMLRRHRARNSAALDPVVLVALLGQGHRLPQVLQHRRQVSLELRLGLAELLDVGQLVVQEPAYQPVQLPRAGHVHPERHVAVLHQHRRLRVLEHDVVPGIAPVELAPDLRLQVVVAVLGLPVAPGHAQRVLHRAVGDHVAGGLQLGNEHQPFLVLAAVGVQAVLEGRADVQLVVRTAELDQFLAPGVIRCYVRVVGHLVNTITNSRCQRNREPLAWHRANTMRLLPGSGSVLLRPAHGTCHVSYTVIGRNVVRLRREVRC